MSEQTNKRNKLGSAFQRPDIIDYTTQLTGDAWDCANTFDEAPRMQMGILRDIAALDHHLHPAPLVLRLQICGSSAGHGDSAGPLPGDVLQMGRGPRHLENPPQKVLDFMASGVCSSSFSGGSGSQVRKASFHRYSGSVCQLRSKLGSELGYSIASLSQG